MDRRDCDGQLSAEASTAHGATGSQSSQFPSAHVRSTIATSCFNRDHAHVAGLFGPTDHEPQPLLS